MDREVEGRIIDLFPAASSFEREVMIRKIGIYGGPRATGFVLRLLDETSRVPFDERAAALFSLSRIAGSDHVDVFERFLGDRHLEV